MWQPLQAMKARNCFKTMGMELTGWKAIVYDITRKMDQWPGGQKSRIQARIEELHILIAEMDDCIEQIRNHFNSETGPDEIQTERESFGNAVSGLRVSAEEAMRGPGGGNFGG